MFVKLPDLFSKKSLLFFGTLAGAGETGKSTFLKQLEIIYEDGYKDQEKRREKFRTHILNCFLENLKIFFKAVRAYLGKYTCISVIIENG